MNFFSVTFLIEKFESLKITKNAKPETVESRNSQNKKPAQSRVELMIRKFQNVADSSHDSGARTPLEVELLK